MYLSFSLSSCGGKKNTQKEGLNANAQIAKIDSLGKAFRKHNSLDKNQADKLIYEYRRFIDSFPTHIKTAELKMELSDLYYGQRQFKYQAQTLREIIEQYPDYKKIDVCYYMLAHILDSEFDERNEAKKFYNGLLDKYPRSVFAADAEARLKTIDSLSFNQLIEAITSKVPEQNP
jgi:TolA-binding protein